MNKKFFYYRITIFNDENLTKIIEGDIKATDKNEAENAIKHLNESLLKNKNQKEIKIEVYD